MIYNRGITVQWHRLRSNGPRLLTPGRQFLAGGLGVPYSALSTPRAVCLWGKRRRVGGRALTLIVATWNVNSVGVRRERLLAFLQREKPDVVFLQELKCTDDRFPMADIATAGWQAAVYGQKTYNGVAILSRAKAEVVRRGFDDGDPDDAARCITAKIGDTWFISVYVPNGQEVGCDKYQYKLRWLERLRSYLARHFSPADRVVLGGDFNVAPGDLDVYAPAAFKEQILCSTPERQALTKVTGLGFFDAFRALHPNSKEFTWWDYRAAALAQNHGLRIDLLEVSLPMLETLTACWVDRGERHGERPSDHAPLLAKFSGL